MVQLAVVFPAPCATFAKKHAQNLLKPRGVPVSGSRDELWQLLSKEAALFPFTPQELVANPLPAPVRANVDGWVKSQAGIDFQNSVSRTQRFLLLSFILNSFSSHLLLIYLFIY